MDVQDDAATIANEMDNSLSPAVKHLLNTGWSGGDLVSLSDSVGWCVCSEDLQKNFPWIDAYLKHYPLTVPSLFFLR